jgi:hypothetical protein
MAQKNLVRARCADGEVRELALVRIEGDTAYLCKASLYDAAINNPEANVEVGFPLKDVEMKEAAN